jgi:hypothetical protein
VVVPAATVRRVVAVLLAAPGVDAGGEQVAVGIG